MNETRPSSGEYQPSAGDMHNALFANMVLQQANMALMFLGQVPHPESGEHVRDLEAAKMFIDTLEMLEVKTKGNLDKREETLLKRNLTALRMAFVDATNQAEASPPSKPPGESAPKSESAAAAAGTSAASAAGADEAESRKKFSKKY